MGRRPRRLLGELGSHVWSEYESLIAPLSSSKSALKMQNKTRCELKGPSRLVLLQYCLRFVAGRRRAKSRDRVSRDNPAERINAELMQSLVRKARLTPKARETYSKADGWLAVESKAQGWRKHVRRNSSKYAWRTASSHQPRVALLSEPARTNSCLRVTNDGQAPLFYKSTP